MKFKIKSCTVNSTVQHTQRANTFFFWHFYNGFFVYFFCRWIPSKVVLNWWGLIWVFAVTIIKKVPFLVIKTAKFSLCNSSWLIAQLILSNLFEIYGLSHLKYFSSDDNNFNKFNEINCSWWPRHVKFVDQNTEVCKKK